VCTPGATELQRSMFKVRFQGGRKDRTSNI